MIDRNAQVGWTDAQWNRVRQGVGDEWSRTRVVGSFLPASGPLPPSTEVVPSEFIRGDGSVDDGATAHIVELSATFTLSAQQVSEEELTDALLSFQRAATALAREEDRLILNGQVPPDQYKKYGWAAPTATSPAPQRRFRDIERRGGEAILTPAWIGRLAGEVQDKESQRFSPVRDQCYSELDDLILPLIEGGLSSPELSQKAPPAVTLLVNTNPGALGLVLAAGSTVFGTPDDGRDLVRAIHDAVSQLDSVGYGPPFACVLGRKPYVTAYTPMPGSLVLPADRIEPLLGRQLIRAPALDEGLRAPEGRGLVISLAGHSMDLAMAAEATPQFTQIDAQGRYVFRVYQRLALRLKDYNAIVRLEFGQATSRMALTPQAAIDATPRRTRSGRQRS